MDSHGTARYSKKVQVWVDEHLYDICKELVDNGLVYKSMADLVRDGMQMAYDKNSGYVDIMNAERAEAANKYSADQMTETRCLIDGTLMRLRVNARWMAVHGSSKLGFLVEDLHNPMLSIANIEEKYGTKIVLYNMHEVAPDDSDDGYKDTYAYKIEHGLPVED